MDPGGSDLESSLPQAENPCLIVEDSQPDSVALEDDPDSSYRALLARRLSNLQPTSHSPVLELISSPSKSRCSQSDSQADKIDVESQADNFQPNLSSAASKHSQVFEVCSGPNSKRYVIRSMPPSCIGRELSVQAILHSQVLESEEAEDDEEIISSQDDLFDGERNGEHCPTSTPAHSLRLLHLSGTLVQESLSQQSVDFVAATQDNLSQTPLIVPNSPTGPDNEQDCNEAAGSPMDTSGPPEDQAERKEEEPMEMDPVPKPVASTPVSQNSPGFTLEKSLSLPTQPEFSHDVFVPTPCLESADCSEALDSSKRKEPQKELPSTSADAETFKKPVESHPSEVAASFQLGIDSENSVFERKTQSFLGDDDSQATQIEEPEESGGLQKGESGPSQCSEKAEKNGVDLSLNKSSNSQQISQESDLKSTQASCRRKEESSEKLLSQSANGQNMNTSNSVTEAQQSQEVQCISNSPQMSQQMGKSVSGKDPTNSGCSQSAGTAGEPATSTAVGAPSQTLSQSVISSHKDVNEGGQGHLSQQRLSQPVSQSHRLDSTKDAEDLNEEEEEKMDEGGIQSTNKTEVASVFGLELSQSQACSPEPMEEEGEIDPQPDPQRVSSKGEGSYSITVLEESQRVSQEIKEKAVRLQTLKSASQPESSSPNEKFEPDRKISSSQPGSSRQPTISGPQNTKATHAGLSEGSQGLNVDNAPNKSLSDSSGDIPFHFTLPREGELIGAAVSATPPHIRQLKNTPLHSTPIETSSFREPSEHDITRETPMAASEISVEESREGEEQAAEGADGKLSLRMKVITPVEDSSPGSDRFSLQSKITPHSYISHLSKGCVMYKNVYLSSSSSVFSRVREVHRQLQAEEEEESSDSPVRCFSLTQTQIFTDELDGVVRQPAQPNGTAVDPDPVATPLADVLPSVDREQEVPSTSAQAQCRTPVRQKAVSQQTSVDLASTPSPFSKRAVSQQTSFDASGPQESSGRGEPVTPTRSQPGPSHRRHIRTIQEVRTTITRIITDVYYEDGKEVDRKVVEESEEPVVDRCVMDSDISPSRTGSSMTSGDLADVSSLSSKALSHHSSSGTSSTGVVPGRTPDFIVPPVRGAKSGRGVRAGQRGGTHGQPGSSSEEEPFPRVNAQVPGSPPARSSSSSHSDSLNTSLSEHGGGASSFVGLRVMAKWSSNSFYYSGTITRDLGENRFGLLFDDNQECEVQGKDILLCDPIPTETEVTALTEEEYFNTGLVKGHKMQGSELLYCVEKDGHSVWYSRKAVILTMEQGNRLREQFALGPYEPSTPQTMASDISLDNLVEGKRRRRGNGNTAGTPTRSATDSPRTPGKRKQSSTEDEKTPAKRGRRGGGAKAGSRLAACNTSGSGVEMPSDPNDLLVSHGPLPESSDLFMGFVFMLTTSSENDRETNQMTSDGEEEYVQTAPYNKHYTERQLEAGGGMILPAFNEEQCKAAYQSLLIADQHCRTRTYLLCVAGGVPCVSQVWVRDCCQEKKLMNYRNYLLPAGLGPEKRVIEWHSRSSPFKALKVLLISEDRVDVWTALLTMCGATKVHQHKTNGNSSDVPAEKFDVVVSAHPCPPEVLKSASTAETPVVSLEWLIQSVICGERLAYDGQPEYRHDSSP
uniref:TP53-binding protein 1 n=1 Tax=Astyanax mexicanus TaxID=7994 RepID=W5LFE7_ASTMX